MAKHQCSGHHRASNMALGRVEPVVAIKAVYGHTCRERRALGAGMAAVKQHWQGAAKVLGGVIVYNLRQTGLAARGRNAD